MARQPGLGRQEAARRRVIRRWLPDQLGDIDDEIRSGLTRITRIANLADADADDVVQPATGLAVGQVKHCPTICLRPGG